MQDRKERDSERYRRKKIDKPLLQEGKLSAMLMKGGGKLKQQRLKLLGGKLIEKLKKGGGRKVLEKRKRGGVRCGFFRNGFLEHVVPCISLCVLIK